MKSRVLRGLAQLSAGLLLLGAVRGFGPAREEAAEDQTAFRGGVSFIATPVFSEAEDMKILALFEGLRVADVADGMDAQGLQNIGLMDPEIHPLWRDTEHFTHRFVGIAVTARYVPTRLPPAGKMPSEAYDQWAAQWYEQRSGEPFIPLKRGSPSM